MYVTACVSRISARRRHDTLCEPCAPEDPGTWQHRCGFRSLARTGGSCVKEFRDLLYSMRAPGASRQGSQLNQVVVLQHSLTAPEVLHLHRLRQSERFEDSKMQRCRATWTRGSNASMQQNHATQPIQRRCSSTITTSRRAGRSQQLHAPPVGLQ